MTKRRLAKAKLRDLLANGPSWEWRKSGLLQDLAKSECHKSIIMFLAGSYVEAVF